MNPDMKKLFILMLVTVFSSVCLGQANANLQRILDTEHSFARAAAERGTKSAFLEYLTDDAVVFVPDQTNGKVFWSARGDSTSLLSWDPNYADVSTNGIFGY